MSYFYYRPYFPTIDEEALPWIEHFISVANANQPESGLSVAQIDDLNDLHLAYSIAVGTKLAAMTAAKQSVTARNAAKAAAIAKLRELAQVVRNNPAVPLALKEDLWLKAPDAPAAPVMPSKPENFASVGNANGWNDLSWERGENPRGMDYVIEVRPWGTTDPWQYVGFTSKTKFRHEGQTPGVALTYRVYAQRNGVKGTVSNTSNVYDPNQSAEVINLAA